MSYCKLEDKTATVTWHYGNGEKMTFIANTVPINVLVGSENYGFWTVDTYDDITQSYVAHYNGTEADIPETNGRTLQTVTGRVISTDSTTVAGSVRIRSAFFTPSTYNAYIKVLDVSGKQIFQDSSSSSTPPIFKVACGTSCPDGYCKCEIPEYPGYCCLDCAATATSIRLITNELRSKNG
ncbi:MAG: hypothetical protein V7K25_24565 [Nostoc sp.]|uniref:hypothetical protein n=1 Tax=Nostoc sp. TaxID=1180 RepID=UPI002FF4C529